MSWWQLEPGSRIIMVGRHDICRSPMAEALLRHRLALSGAVSKTVESAGTHVMSAAAYADRRVSQVLAFRKITIKRHRARLLKAEQLHKSSRILAMDNEILTYLRLLAPREAIHRIHLMTDWCDSLRGSDIPDPYFSNLAGFERVRDMLEMAIDAFVESEGGIFYERFCGPRP